MFVEFTIQDPYEAITGRFQAFGPSAAQMHQGTIGLYINVAILCQVDTIGGNF